MKFHAKIVSIVLLIAISLAGGAVQGQDDAEPHEYVRMLSAIPATAVTVPLHFQTQIAYADFRAAEQARPGVRTPADWAEFRQVIETDGGLWLATTQRLIAVPSDLYMLMFDSDTVNYCGLDFFEIDRALFFDGPPPTEEQPYQDGTLYGGHFDVDRIQATFIRRTYTATELNGIPVLCGPVGCENGDQGRQWLPDQQDIDPKSFKHSGQYPIFGGRLGRQQPIALLPGLVLTTPNWEIMSEMTAAAGGAAPSLIDLPEFRAVADFAVDGVRSSSQPDDPGKLLVQVIHFAPTMFSFNVYYNIRNLLEDPALATERQIMEAFGVDGTGKPVDWDDLPEYTLGALVDHQDGADQVHSVALVYFDEDDARQAADEVARRIPEQAFLEKMTTDPMIDYAVPSYTVESHVVYDPAVMRWLAVTSVRVPMPSNDPDPADENRIEASGRLMQYWYRSLIAGLFTPVLLTPPLR